ncbi:MAG: hypothetical protein M1823_003395 [Watsoniomyces obsoletus]|nr:MAG: hypothetical protein M1823_003395 [Watsoniomyces obsoletus]
MLGIQSSKGISGRDVEMMAEAISRAGGQTFSFHLLPSGLVNPSTDNFIGSGVVFHPEAFFRELHQLESQGVPRVRERIHDSSRCHLNFALHGVVDELSERELGTGQIGTRKRGIGPAYGAKATRDGLRVIDLYDESFEQKLRSLAQGYRRRYGELLGYSVEEELERYRAHKEQLRPYIVDAVEYMTAARENRRSVLVEDVDFSIDRLKESVVDLFQQSNMGTLAKRCKNLVEKL